MLMGNMEQVRDALQIGQVVDYLPVGETIDPRMAEVVPGVEPKWCLIQVFSRDAEKHLAERGFGLYVPEYRESIVRRGRKIDSRRPMFPGYLLVFMWLGGGNWGRVVASDGVVGIVGTLHDEEVDLIRAVENKGEFPRYKPRQSSRASKAMRASMRRRRWEDWLVEIRSPCSERRNQALRNLLRLF